jgi:exosortase/archaeosortase family protein
LKVKRTYLAAMSGSNTNKSSRMEGIAFIWKSMLAYAIWFVVRTALTGIDFLSVYWYQINDYFASLYVKLSAISLKAMGYGLRYNDRNVLLDGTPGLYVGNHCLGLSASFIFVFIIFLLKGRLLYKVAYSFFGLGVIFFVNWFRVVGLAIMLKHGTKAFFHFNHTYTYLIMVYGIIFAMIIFYENRLSKL